VLEYRVVSSEPALKGEDHIVYLEGEVNDRILEGWRPMGGVVVKHKTGTGFYLMQTLVRAMEALE